MYGLIGTGKLNDINPGTYLEYVLTHIADQKINRIDELLPWNVADKLATQPNPPPHRLISRRSSGNYPLPSARHHYRASCTRDIANGPREALTFVAASLAAEADNRLPPSPKSRHGAPRPSHLCEACSHAPASTSLP
ncbi:hypothetical protein OKW50_008094 [Paraburkholderia youngii]